MGCADVRVLDHFNARPAGLKDTPAWEPQVSLQTGSFGTPAAYQMFGSEPLQHTVPKPVTGQGPANASKPAAPDAAPVDSPAGLAPSPAPYLNPKLRGPPPGNANTPAVSPSSPGPQITPTPPGQTTDIMPSPAPNPVTNTPSDSTSNDTLAATRPLPENQTVPFPPVMHSPPYPVIHMGFKLPQSLNATGSMVSLSTEPQSASVPLPGTAASSPPGVRMVLPSPALAVSPSSPVTSIATADGSSIPVARPPLEPQAVRPSLEAPSFQGTYLPAAGAQRPLQPPAAGSAAAEPAAPSQSFKLPQHVEAPKGMAPPHPPGRSPTLQQPATATSLGDAMIYDTGLSLKLPQRINLPQGLPSPPPQP